MPTVTGSSNRCFKQDTAISRVGCRMYALDFVGGKRIFTKKLPETYPQNEGVKKANNLDVFGHLFAGVWGGVWG